MKKIMLSIALLLPVNCIFAEVSQELTGIKRVNTYVSLSGDYQMIMLDEDTIKNLVELELMRDNISIIDREACNATKDLNILKDCIESPGLTSNVLVLQIGSSDIFSMVVELSLGEMTHLPRLNNYNFSSFAPARQYITSWNTQSIISCQSDRCPSFVKEVIENQLKKFILGIYKANAELEKLSP